MKIYFYLYALLVIIFSTVCSFSYETIGVNENVLLIGYPINSLNFSDTDYKDAVIAFTKSCDKLLSFGEDANIFRQLSDDITVADIVDTCKVAFNVKDRSEKYIEFFFKNYFVPYLVVDKTSNSQFGVFTGYYLPELNVRKNKDYIFRYPIYRKPDDLVKDVPYFTREEINKGALNNRNLELFYTDNLVDLFFLQIQGSGFVKDIDSGELIKIGFDAKNNQEYSSIGRILLEKNLINSNRLNSIDIKNFLKDNIDAVQGLMNLNKSYIFFKIIDDNKIVGSQGVELTDNVSLAVDTRYIPLGLPILLNTDLTLKDGVKKPLNKIMVSQDTGSAINGVVRGDIFFGGGELAEELASYQYSNGQYFVLIPRGIEYKLVNSNND